MKHSTNQDPIQEAWPPLPEGPYVIKRRDYKKRIQAVQDEYQAERLSPEEAQCQIQQMIDDAYPTILGRYQIVGYRKGSMGIAYLCVDKRWHPNSPHSPFVVCKRSDNSSIMLGDQIAIDALRGEARIWLELSEHPNVVKLLDVLAASTNLTLVMEAVLPGPQGRTTLRDWLNQKALSRPLAVRFSREIARAMLHCQRSVAEFVHGDIKPENLLIDIASGYHLKVSDFGLARASGFLGPRLGESLGTPLYLAPECWEGQEPTEKSDIYATGMIMYEMFIGEHPFAHITGIDNMKDAHLSGPPSRPHINFPVSDNIPELIVNLTDKVQRYKGDKLYLIPPFSIFVANGKAGTTRMIPLNQTVCRIFVVLVGDETTGRWLFSKNGQPIKSIKKGFSAACERAQIEDLRPYDLRHTFATRLVERNVQTIVISVLLGHTQPLQGFGHASRITPGYAHATYDAMRWAVDSLEHPPQITAFEQKSSKSRANGSEAEDEKQLVKAG